MNSVDWSAMKRQTDSGHKKRLYMLWGYYSMLTNTHSRTHTNTDVAVLVARGVAAMQSAQHKAFH